jgi:hypothetical protein
MDPSQYAFVHGVRTTRATLRDWNRRPFPVVGSWVAGALAAAILLLLAVLVIAGVSAGNGPAYVHQPPFQTGDLKDVARILGHNLLVLALHAMACVAGFIAGASLPIQAEHKSGLSRAIHQRGGRLAIVFVVCATLFSLTVQAVVIGDEAARVARVLNVSPALLLLGTLPHALPELTALFLPLAAWIIASRREQWDQLLAATVVTVSISLPVLVVCAFWEVYAAPHVLHAVLG